MTGGSQSMAQSSATLSSTELSVNEGAWSIATFGNLPMPFCALRGVSLNNNVFMTGEQIFVI